MNLKGHKIVHNPEWYRCQPIKVAVGVKRIFPEMIGRQVGAKKIFPEMIGRQEMWTVSTNAKKNLE